MDIIRTGIIGCGGYAAGAAVPALKANNKYVINAVMDIDEMRAQKLADDTGAKYYTTDLDRMLNDSEIDAVFITTRHETHADFSIRAANAGKHILCEKPMALNREECLAIASAVRENNVVYSVGYNRGMAPSIIKAKELLKPLDAKRMIYHRIQAPFPAEHWTHVAGIGGGRLVGEGCHIFDLLCELVEAPPVSVYAAGGFFLDSPKVEVPDSAIVTINFADGSVGVTLIASDGCASMDKEATEIYCAGKAIHIKNFQSMEYFGFEGHNRISIELDSVDKGYPLEVDKFADAVLTGSTPPNSVPNAMRAACISYTAYESMSIQQQLPVDCREWDI